MLNANENYFESTYITDFNSLELMSSSDVNAQMNKSTIADVGDRDTRPTMIFRCIYLQKKFRIKKTMFKNDRLWDLKNTKM